MSARELRVEMLLGRPVIAANGHSVGRVEDIRAEVRGQGAVVTEVLIGPAAALERLSAHVTRLIRRIALHSGQTTSSITGVSVRTPERGQVDTTAADGHSLGV